MDYRKHQQSKATEPASSDQVENSAGGYVWEVDIWERLRRFLILGTEGGSYYASERELTRENLDVLDKCLTSDGERMVDTITGISDAGRAVKSHPAIFALAVALEEGDEFTRRKAARAVNKVCRTGRHLFQLADYMRKKPGTGRVAKRAFCDWYNEMDAGRLAYQITKYRGTRGNWTHGDIINVCHPDPPDEEHSLLYKYATDGELDKYDEDLSIVYAFEKAKRADEEETIQLIEEHGLPREAVMNRHLDSPEVWEALLDNQGRGMPLWALVRNLATLGRVGLLEPLSSTTREVAKQLTNEEKIRYSRMHPLKILQAMHYYKKGSNRSGNWKVVPAVVDALDEAFYLSFGNVESTGNRTLLGLDVSSSMTSEVSGMGISCRVASAAMALVTSAAEDMCMGLAFSAEDAGLGGLYSRNTKMKPFDVSPRQRLDDVVQEMQQMPFGRTDCSLPMVYAMQEDIEVDLFVIYTDSETNTGEVHPADALREYRRQTGIPAKLAVVGMNSNGFTIADPSDDGMLDFIGFDTSTPQAISAFATTEE